MFAPALCLFLNHGCSRTVLLLFFRVVFSPLPSARTDLDYENKIK